MEDTVLPAETPAATATPAVPPASLLPNNAWTPPPLLTDDQILTLLRTRCDFDVLSSEEQQQILAAGRKSDSELCMIDGKLRHRSDEGFVSEILSNGSWHYECARCGELSLPLEPAPVANRRRKSENY